MENLIKLRKAQLASDRMSCHSATANQVRLALHTATFWLMHCVRSAIPQTNPLARCEFATLRECLIKIGARVIEHIARIRVQLPTSCPVGALFRAVASPAATITVTWRRTSGSGMRRERDWSTNSIAGL